MGVVASNVRGSSGSSRSGRWAEIGVDQANFRLERRGLRINTDFPRDVWADFCPPNESPARGLFCNRLSVNEDGKKVNQETLKMSAGQVISNLMNRKTDLLQLKIERP
jgi:hypothetical protein